MDLCIVLQTGFLYHMEESRTLYSLVKFQVILFLFMFMSSNYLPYKWNYILFMYKIATNSSAFVFLKNCKLVLRYVKDSFSQCMIFHHIQ